MADACVRTVLWLVPTREQIAETGSARARHPPGGREELFAAWRTFLGRMAADGTVVLVFEDLQWADAGPLEVIDHLLEWSRGVPLYVLTLARSPAELRSRASSAGHGWQAT
jgi:predicted ATPase